MTAKAKRTKEQMDYLLEETKKLDFFKEIIDLPEYIEKQTHLKCCKDMTFSYVKKGQVVFQEG